MDMETYRRLEREADQRDQTLAVLEHLKRKAERRRFLAFCFNWRQIVDEPTVTEPIPGASAFVSGVGPGAADSEPSGAVSHTPAPRFVGPAGPGEPQLAVSSPPFARGRRMASEKPGSATPHHT